MRKIIQITAFSETVSNSNDIRQQDSYTTVLALCDDGTLWVGVPNIYNANWQQIQNVPQPLTPESTNG